MGRDAAGRPAQPHQPHMGIQHPQEKTAQPVVEGMMPMQQPNVAAAPPMIPPQVPGMVKQKAPGGDYDESTMGGGLMPSMGRY